jgi:hypothetical protein
MNPTHDKDDLARRYGTAAAALVDLLTHPGRFRAWIGKAVTTTAASVPAVPDLPDGDAGLVLTDAGREALAVTASAGDSEEPAGTCQVCDYAHAADEPCRFAACARCDRLFEGLSLSQYCADCPPFGPEAFDEDIDGTECLFCGAPGGYPYCLSSHTRGVLSCAEVVAADQAEQPAEPGSPAEILPLAAQYLERHGWIQGAYYDPTATVFTPAADLVGAIGMVCYGGPVEAPAQHFADPGFLDFEEAVLHLDRYLLVEDGSESYEFNDARGRRKEDVLRVLRDAAARSAEELIDALRVLSAQDDWTADRVRLLVPSGAFAARSNGEPPVAESIGGACCPRCGTASGFWRQVVDDDGSGLWGYCDHDWHNDGDSDGGDAR